MQIIKANGRIASWDSKEVFLLLSFCCKYVQNLSYCNWQWLFNGQPSTVLNSRLCVTAATVAQNCYSGGCLNAKASLLSPTNTIAFPQAHLWQNSEESLIHHRSWTSSTVWSYGWSSLIAAPVLSYVERELLKWSVEDEQAAVVNMTSLRVRGDFTGAYSITSVCCAWIVVILEMLLQFIGTDLWMNKEANLKSSFTVWFFL